jgi:hypothetical protein
MYLKMKKIKLILIFVAIFIANKSKGQVPDTLNYLRSLVTNKSQFVGQNFTHLVNQLPIQIRYFFARSLSSKQMYIEKSTAFCFYRPLNSEELEHTYPRLVIFWQGSQNIRISDSFRKIWNGQFITPLLNHYGSCIVADIELEE